MPAVEGDIAAVVAAVLHEYVPPPDAVSVTLPPVQNVVEPVGVIVAVAALTVTTVLAVAVHVLAAVTVTV